MQDLIQRIQILACLSVLAALFGCGQKPPAVEDAPFRAAVVEYLQNNNMALAIKEIKAAPTVEGGNARMSASLTGASPSSISRRAISPCSATTGRSS